MQDSPHVPRVILHPGKLLDHLSDSRQRPQICFEAVPLRTKTQRGIYPTQLPCIEPGLASGTPCSLELLNAPFHKTEKPSAYALTADAKGPGNFRLLLASSKQLSSSGTSPFHAFEVSPWPEN
jgi:hypothetical protein